MLSPAITFHSAPARWSSVVVNMPKGQIIIVTGPSGGGKTTLANLLLANDLTVKRVVTCTTREPRAGEVDGVDYHFLSQAQFDAYLAADAFIEHANVYGKCYGTLKQSIIEITKTGDNVLLVMDVQGAKTIRSKKLLPTIVVFLSVPIDTLRLRLVRRGKDEAITINKRLKIAELEMAQAEDFDHIIHSESPEDDLAAMQKILAGHGSQT